jgi:hypothetical protein
MGAEAHKAPAAAAANMSASITRKIRDFVSMDEASSTLQQALLSFCCCLGLDVSPQSLLIHTLAGSHFHTAKQGFTTCTP